VKTSVPATAGAETLHVSGEPLQLGFDVVRLLAIMLGDPVYATAFTVESVMTTDCVDADTYAGVRCVADAAVAAGTVMVKVALVDAFAGVEMFDSAGVLGVRTDCAPPPQAVVPASAIVASARVAFFTEWALPAS
jgi:hypothetical protein